MIKTYRGLLADGGQDKIPLATKDGSVGYRIIKFQLFPTEPGQANAESTVKIFKTEQSSIDNTVNFTDSDLLAAAYYQDALGHDFPSSRDVIFEREIFNQDIFVTHQDTVGSDACNYYIELEQMKLDQTQNMSATLKAIRGSAVD